jgi:alpha-L-fucosidase
VDAWSGGAWREISRGTTIGHRKLDRIEPVTTDRIRLTIERSLDVPRLARLSLL